MALKKKICTAQTKEKYNLTTVANGIEIKKKLKINFSHYNIYDIIYIICVVAVYKYIIRLYCTTTTLKTHIADKLACRYRVIIVQRYVYYNNNISTVIIATIMVTISIRSVVYYHEFMTVWARKCVCVRISSSFRRVCRVCDFDRPKVERFI